MSFNYSIIDAFKLLSISFKYNIFIAIIISSIIFTIILIINKDRKFKNYIISIINVVLISIIIYYYFNDIISFNFNNPINNIYFYFFNSVIYLVVMSIFTFIFNKSINFIFYLVSLINILFSLFMTNYLGNNTLIVMGNIIPMIKFGNIIYIVYYVYVIACLIKRYKIYKYAIKN